MALAALGERSAAAGRFGIDTEFVGEGRYRTLLCVIQLVVSDEQGLEVVVLDALDEGRPGAARGAARRSGDRRSSSTPAARTSRCCGAPPDGGHEHLRHAGRRRFRRPPAQAGYETLLREVLGVRVQKTASYTRWDRRPLDAEQLAYAREDVLHLLELATALERRLRDAGRLAWALEECRFLERRERPRDVDTVFAGCRGSTRCPRRRGRSRASSVRWREEIAERQDRPVTTVLNDAALVELAKRAPRTPGAARPDRGVNPGSLRRRGVELLAAIATARRSRRSPSRSSATSRACRSTARRSRSPRRSCARAPWRPGWPTS